MFTGIVFGLGRVVSLEQRGGGLRLAVDPPAAFGRIARGESVCVSGVCLTALSAGRRLSADLSAETIRRTRLAALSPSDPVNLERALRWGDRLSGHFVLGHVDGIARIKAVTREGNSWTYRFSLPRAMSRFVATKGSIAVDGVSLTVSARRGSSFDVAVIPETRRRTTLGKKRPGDAVHLEADPFARYGRAGWRRKVKPRRK